MNLWNSFGPGFGKVMGTKTGPFWLLNRSKNRRRCTLGFVGGKAIV